MIYNDSPTPWRLLMRTAKRLSSVNSISYSFSDSQVVNLVRYSLVLGALTGGVATAFAFKFFL